MADAILHIKDSYYFEVPKFLAPAAYRDRTEFPPAWGKIDPSFQDWEFDKIYHELESICPKPPDHNVLHHQWKEWQHQDHANAGKPFDTYLEEAKQAHLKAFGTWKAAQLANVEPARRMTEKAAVDRLTVADYLKDEQAIESGKVPFPEQAWFSICTSDSRKEKQWEEVAQKNYWKEYVDPKTEAAPWGAAKIAQYNDRLSGKILIPQPFGELRNLYERESGLTISKFVLIELGIALALILIFSWVASRLRDGLAPRGTLLNLLEVFLLYIRDQIARPAIGAHHDDHDEGHGNHGHGDDHGKHAVAHAKPHVHHSPWEQADSFVPLLWTMFFFILFCNLSGMIPWLGSPTGSFSVTLALALGTFVVVCISGMKQFGFLGFFANQIPSMDLPFVLALGLKPMIFVIEMFGLLIKHLVLSIRLLANMVAGHLVILAFLGMAFGAEAALKFSAPGVPGWQWYLTAAISILGVTAINLLELLVALLQAYVFTFLSALFIGAAVHKH